MRVDGVGNVMTCQVPATEGLVVETQNVVGSAENDLLAATDWFFPSGMNHHEMFTGWKPLNQVMQKIARRIAGIGELPAKPIQVAPSREETCDVLVVGAGAAGMIAARECAASGLSTLVVDDGNAGGGHLALHASKAERDRAAALLTAAKEKGARFLFQHTAVGVYDELVLVDGMQGAIEVRPRRLVLATGMHEGSMALPGADLPGVMGVRAMSALYTASVAAGENVVIVGDDPAAVALEQALTEASIDVKRVAFADVKGFRGNTKVKWVDLHRNGANESLACDAVALVSPLSAAYELPSQAGASILWRDDRFVVDGESAADGSFARVIGECAGVQALDAIEKQARDAAARIVKELRA